MLLFTRLVDQPGEVETAPRPTALACRDHPEVPYGAWCNRRRLPGSDPTEGGSVYARIATFEGDPTNLDDAISHVRAEVESGQAPPGLEGAKMLMLVNRASGKSLGITLFDSEEAMQRGDEALNAMNPGAPERRRTVEFYEVPVQTIR
jgi:hypothetical protein